MAIFFQMKSKSFIIGAIGLLLPLAAMAQDVGEMRDTLSAAVKESTRFVRTVDGFQVRVKDIQALVAPTGEADIIKFVQLFPGVSTGAEGSSAIYVRGGNLGGTRISLDGVPVYGNAHLLGFTQSAPLDVMEDAHVRINGFRADEGNFTDAHICMTTQEGIAEKLSGQLSASPAFLSSNVNVPVLKDLLSFIGSVRWSPAAAIWNGLKLEKHIPEVDLKDVRANVYDLFGKLNWNIDKKQNLSLSFFHSNDDYEYAWRQTRADMAWQTSILNLKYRLEAGTGHIDGALSWNHFKSNQVQEHSVQAENHLGIANFLTEWTARVTAAYPIIGADEFSVGINYTQSSYLPSAVFSMTGGSRPDMSASSFSDSPIPTKLGTVSMQWEKARNNKYLLRAGGRLNFHQAAKGKEFTAHGEYDVIARVHFIPCFGIEASVDKRKQFHHLLEGLPTGWSLDMIVPADETYQPEEALQYAASMFFQKGHVSVSVGGYTKEMKNVVCYRNAVNIFSPSVAGWKSDVDVGTGSSKGLEVLAEYIKGENSIRVAYTLSKTDRVFPLINHGLAFPFQFDRRHIFNASGNGRVWHGKNAEISVSGLVTYQSGNWETVPEGYFHPWMFEMKEETKIEYYSDINNYRMDHYFRVDLGCTVAWDAGRCSHKVYLGAYNLTNRHNPLSLIYDIDEQCWKQVSLLPVVPTVKYSVGF